MFRKMITFLYFVVLLYILDLIEIQNHEKNTINTIISIHF